MYIENIVFTIFNLLIFNFRTVITNLPPEKIKFIIITFIITGICQISFDLFRELGMKDQEFECDPHHDSSMFLPINISGDIYMFFY